MLQGRIVYLLLSLCLQLIPQILVWSYTSNNLYRNKESTQLDRACVKKSLKVMDTFYPHLRNIEGAFNVHGKCSVTNRSIDLCLSHDKWELLKIENLVLQAYRFHTDSHSYLSIVSSSVSTNGFSHCTPAVFTNRSISPRFSTAILVTSQSVRSTHTVFIPGHYKATLVSRSDGIQ